MRPTAWPRRFIMKTAESPNDLAMPLLGLVLLLIVLRLLGLLLMVLHLFGLLLLLLIVPHLLGFFLLLLLIISVLYSIHLLVFANYSSSKHHHTNSVTISVSSQPPLPTPT